MLMKMGHNSESHSATHAASHINITFPSPTMDPPLWISLYYMSIPYHGATIMIFIISHFHPLPWAHHYEFHCIIPIPYHGPTIMIFIVSFPSPTMGPPLWFSLYHSHPLPWTHHYDFHCIIPIAYHGPAITIFIMLILLLLPFCVPDVNITFPIPSLLPENNGNIEI